MVGGVWKFGLTEGLELDLSWWPSFGVGMNGILLEIDLRGGLRYAEVYLSL